MADRERLTEINDHITLIDDNGEATCYLVRGKDKALLIDTTNGFIDLAKLCARLTELPVTVVCTHGHCDHVFGNLYFDKAYLHPDDFKLHDEHFQFDDIREIMQKTGLTPAQLVPLAVGDVFDLGGLTLEAVSLKGHTPGSIGLLCREDRILFSGDGANTHIWMQLPESTSIAVLKRTLDELLAQHGSEFDHILTGHGKGLEDIERVRELSAACGDLLAGKTQSEQPYEYFAGTCLAHPFGPDDGSRIVYTQEKLA